MSLLQVRVNARNTGGNQTWEGTVSIPGLKPTKLVRRSDNSTSFATRSAVVNASRTLVRSLNFSDVEVTVSGVTSTATPSRKAAKRSVRSLGK